MTSAPNKRVQRTRVARFARPGSPLTRRPLGSLFAPNTVNRLSGVGTVGRGDARASSQSEGGRAHITCQNPFQEAAA